MAKLSAEDHHKEYRKYLDFAQEALDAIAAKDTSNYDFLEGEIPGLEEGGPLRQVIVVYDKRDQSYKGFIPLG